MESITTTPSDLKKAALINSLSWAAINIAIFLIVFYVQPALTGSFVWSIIQMLIGLGLAVYFSLDLRSKAGGYWTFKEALSSIFILFIVQALIVYTFTIVFGKFIEPTYIQKMTDIILNSVTERGEKMGLAQDQIDEMIKQAEVTVQAQFNPGFKQALMGLATIIIMYFIFSLIFAAIMKREKPLFAPVTDEQ